MDIVASDEDHGRNADITYTILEENDWEQFEIDAKSGQLTFKNKLDRETKSSYEVCLHLDVSCINSVFQSSGIVYARLTLKNVGLPCSYLPTQNRPYPKNCIAFLRFFFNFSLILLTNF